MADITQAQLKKLLHYDPDTGVFTSAIRRKNFRVGDVVGRQHTNGYPSIKIGIHRYLNHRLAWLYVHGVFPTGCLDHINCDHSDNRIANLREATGSQNQWNTLRRRDNTSGVKGVSWHKARRKWDARIKQNGRRTHLGSFNSLEDARAAYAAAAQERFGEFARLK